MQKTFIQEYVQVMAPIACGLDVLQGELVISLGYLLPTMYIVKSQFLELLDRPTLLTICQPLVRALLSLGHTVTIVAPTAHECATIYRIP